MVIHVKPPSRQCFGVAHLVGGYAMHAAGGMQEASFHASSSPDDSWQSIGYIHAVALLVFKCERDRDSTHACHHEAVSPSHELRPAGSLVGLIMFSYWPTTALQVCLMPKPYELGPSPLPTGRCRQLVTEVTASDLDNIATAVYR